MNCRVWITTQFAGFHMWTGAPAEISYLADMHRHIFKVRVEVLTKDGDEDRTVEFHTLKKATDFTCQALLRGENVTWSCEEWAYAIGQALIESRSYPVVSVEVSEDGENGATVDW